MLHIENFNNLGTNLVPSYYNLKNKKLKTNNLSKCAFSHLTPHKVWVHKHWIYEQENKIFLTGQTEENLINTYCGFIFPQEKNSSVW